jgi:hypothetical protein
MHVFCVFIEKSDQTGTSELVGVYSSKRLSDEAQGRIRTRRSFVKEIVLDAALLWDGGFRA